MEITRAFKERFAGIALLGALFALIWWQLFSGQEGAQPELAIEQVKGFQGAERYVPETPRLTKNLPAWKSASDIGTEPVRAIDTPPAQDANGLPVGWVVQVGSFKVHANARRALQKLRQAEILAFIQSRVDQQGQRSYLLLAGPKIEKALAARLSQQIEQTFGYSSLVRRYRP